MRLGRTLAALFILAVLAASLGGYVALAQQDDAAEKSSFVRYVEDTISTPDRRISLGRIDGALSSDVRISSITIADRQGVWLTIEGAHLVWSRLALLRRRFDIDLLEAKSITISRRPLPPEGLQPASSGFALPELPVSVRLTKLQVPVVAVDKSIAGEDTTLAVAGGGRLEAGSLDAELAIERTKPQGGRLFAKASYADATRLLDLNLTLEEPKNGFLSTLLDLPGRPGIAFSVVGSGPLDKFAADIALSADGERLLAGRATLSQGQAGIDFAGDLTGSLQRLVSPAYADFFAGTSSLSVATRRLPDGGLALDRADIRSGVLALGLTGVLSPDYFPTSFSARGTLGTPDRRSVLLPGTGGATVDAVSFDGSLAEGGWRANFDMEALAAGTVRAGRAHVEASGSATKLADAASRSLSFTFDGKAQDLASDDPDVARALGDAMTLGASGNWRAGQPVTIDEIRFANANATARFAGRLDGNDLDGTYSLAASDLTAFAGLAGSKLSGSVDLTAKGRVAVIGGAFSLALDGKGQDLTLGVGPLDPLLAGQTRLSGNVARNPDGLSFDGVRLAGRALDARLGGRFGVKTVDLEADAKLPDLRLVTDRAEGAASLTASLKGPAETPAIEAVLSAPRLALQGKALQGAELRFAGTLPSTGPNGTIAGSGTFDGRPIRAAATIATGEDGTITLSGLDAGVGPASLAGNLVLQPGKLASGQLTLNVPEIAEVAPLFLLRGSGRLSADLQLAHDGSRQRVAAKADAANVKVETIALGTAHADAVIEDLFGVPSVAGTVDARTVAVGSFLMPRLHATASKGSARATNFQADADLAGGHLSTSGSLVAAENGFDVTLARLDLRQGGLAAALTAPITVRSRPAGLAIPRATLKISQGGSVSIEGTAGDRLDLSVDVTALPAALANLASPSLGATGTVSGSARIGGSAANPTAEFSVKGDGLSVAAARSAGLPPLQLAANGRLAREILTIDASAKGTGGIAVTGSGTVPLTGKGLSLAVKGSAPLAAANALLSERAAKLTGTLSVDARVTGSLAAPHFEGSATIARATFSDPETGMQLSGIAASLRFDGDRLRIERLSAITPGNGTLGVTGAVSLKGDFPLDLAVTFRNAKLTDGRIVTVVVSGDLTVRGPALGEPTIAGRIAVARAEITIPERFAHNAALLGVKHLAPPPEVRATLARLRKAQGGEGGRQFAGINLDITIDAPSRIFVRGRGLDAELGGQVRLTGPISKIAPVGAFELRRGALNVIGQRITLDRGEVRLVGNLDPEIDLSATTRSSTIVVTARVTGRASDPQIVLSSVPELPQDEILAQFLFGHSINDLSPFQIVQLATAVAQLAGGQGEDLLSSIRKSTGLDTLSITTDAKGNPGLEAGRYISERIYFGLATGASGQTNATINLDVTRNLKARAAAGTEGGSLGVFYEREY